MVQSHQNLLASRLARKQKEMSTSGGKEKKRRKSEEITPGEGSGTTPESLGPSDAAIRSITASSAEPQASPSHHLLLKRKKATDKKISTKEKERGKGKTYHHQWSRLLGSSFPEAYQHLLAPPRQW